MEGKQGMVVLETSGSMEGKRGMAALAFPGSQNPIAQVQARFKEMESGFKSWLAKQSMPVEAAIVTAKAAVEGAALGGLMGSLNVSAAVAPPLDSPGLSPEVVASLKQAQAFAGGPWLQARNFAVMTGANACISSVMKRIRGVEDVQSSMVSAFGSGALFSLVSGMGGGAVGNANPGVSALTTGLFFAFLQGGLFTFGQKFGQPAADDAFYYRTRSMLLNLGLQKYEKNFKKGLLTDKTLPLLTDSALRDVRIPPGPRLLILDHIQRDEDLANERR